MNLTLESYQKYEFNPDVNIIYGINGCGKTTLLKLLKKKFGKGAILLASNRKDDPQVGSNKFDDFLETVRKYLRAKAGPPSEGEESLTKIFKAAFSDHTHVLIDEPERSLHVEWQRKMVADLMKVHEKYGTQFFLTTHSPQIVHNRPDKMIALVS